MKKKHRVDWTFIWYVNLLADRVIELYHLNENAKTKVEQKKWELLHKRAVYDFMFICDTELPVDFRGDRPSYDFTLKDRTVYEEDNDDMTREDIEKYASAIDFYITQKLDPE